MGKKFKPTPTRVSAFGKDNFSDYFKRLEYRYNKYKEDLTSVDEAEAFSIYANHLHKDWLKFFFVDSEAIMQTANLSIGNEIEMIRDIADGLKHIELNRPPHLHLVHQEEESGGFSSGFSIGFNSPYLSLTNKSYQKIYFERIAANVFDYWQTYLVKNKML